MNDSRNPVAASLVILGIVSISLLIWTNHINNRSDEYLRLADALMDLEIYTASSHFKLEESYHKEVHGSVARSLSDLDYAEKIVGAILNGGEAESGLKIRRLRDPQLRKRIEVLASMLSEMKAIAVQMQHSQRDNGLDQRYDALCDVVLSEGKSLELLVEKMEAADRLDSRRLFYGIVVLWSGIVAVSVLGMRRHEKERRKAEAALLDLNVELERKTKELGEHKEHLMELVERRTTVLKISNEELRNEIFDRRQAEEALRKSEEQYRMLIETMNEGLATLDGKDKITYANENFCRILRRSRDELLGQSIGQFLASNKDKDLFSEHLKKIRFADHGRFEAAFSTKEGIAFTMVSLKRLVDPIGSAVGSFAVITDITEKRDLLDKSIRSASLAYLGQIAAGVAHEINNPINGIINYAQLICDGSREDQNRKLAVRIQREGRRIAEIMKGLLLSARGGNKEKVPIPLNEILSSALGLAGSDLQKDKIAVAIDVPPDLPELIADPQEMQQVFLNIVNNARHALIQKYPGEHENKIMRISARMAALDGSPCVRITVRDHGGGIPSGIIEKVKQPFFSTRPKGKGTGLGLSISSGIINGAGGRLTIESVEGEYTEIIIDMPVTAMQRIPRNS